MATLRVGKLSHEAAFDQRAVPICIGLLLGLRVPIIGTLTLGMLVALLAAPIWMIYSFRYLWYRFILGFALLALLTGLLLIPFKSDSRYFDASQAVNISVYLFGSIFVVGALVYCCNVLGRSRAVVLFCLGWFVSGLLEYSHWSGNAWKYALALPVSLLLLSLIPRRLSFQIPLLLLLFAVDIAFSYRSLAGVSLLVALLLVLSSALYGNSTWRRSVLLPSAVTLVCISTLFNVMTTVALSGSLGAEIQNRSLTQVERGGNLLEGGRPEWSGTYHLMENSPVGYGLGIVPNSEDASELKSGLREVNLAVGGQYVNRFMLGTQFKLHSTMADLWVNFGLGGLALAAVFGAALFYHFLRSLRSRSHALGLFSSCISLWFLGFGPILTNLPDIAFALGIAIYDLGSPILEDEAQDGRC